MSPYESQTSGSSSIGKDLKSPTIREVAEKSKVGLLYMEKKHGNKSYKEICRDTWGIVA